MTGHPANRDRWLFRGLPLGGAIAVMIAGAGIATVDSYSAARQQQRAAARALHDYAVFASYTYSQNAYSSARNSAFSAFAGLEGFNPRSSDDLPPEAIVLPPAVKCESMNRAGPYRFRLDLPSRVLHASRSSGASMGLWQQLDHLGSGQRASPVVMTRAFETLLSDTLAFLAGTVPIREAGWGYAFVRSGDTREALAFHPVYAASGVPVAVYGYQACIDHSQFASLYRDVQPLPSTLTSSLPRDSLLQLRVTDGAGNVLYTSATDPRDAPYTGVTSLPLVAGLRFAVSIRPALVSDVLRNASPSWGMQRALALLLLTVALGALALVLFRRETRFVRAREDFVTDVSHELRTPLQQILLFAQLLRLDRLQNEGERTRSLRIIETETMRLIGLVANILDRARPQSREPVRCPVDIHELIRNSIALFQPLAATRHAAIVLSGESAIVMADPEALHQVITNLLDNAVKYGPPGQTISVTTVLFSESVVINIDDQGPGIPVEDREKAWEPFVRLGPTAKRSSGGVGIGLAIVRAAVQRMSGTITIADSPSGGARFTLRLPRDPAATAPAIVTPQSPAPDVASDPDC